MIVLTVSTLNKILFQIFLAFVLQNKRHGTSSQMQDERPLPEIEALTPTLLASARSNVKRARSELIGRFPTGLFAPATDQSLLDWLEDGRRYSNGDRLVSNKVLATVNGKKQLTDRTAHILRSIQYEFDIPMRRMPGLWNAFAVLFLDRPLQSNGFSSVPTLGV